MRRLLVEAEPQGRRGARRARRSPLRRRARPPERSGGAARETADDCSGDGAAAQGRPGALRRDPAAAAALRPATPAVRPARSTSRLAPLYARRQHVRRARDRVRDRPAAALRPWARPVLRALPTDRIGRQARRRPARRPRHGTGLLRFRHLLRVARRGWNDGVVAGRANGRRDSDAAHARQSRSLALFAIERETAVIDAVRAWWLLRRAHRNTRARLRRRRSELADLLDEVNRWLWPEAAGQGPEAGRG